MSTALHLYQITDALHAIEETLLENGGELTPELEEALNAMEGALEAKVDGIAGLVQHLARMSEAAKAEEKRLADLAKSRANAAARLKEYLLRELSDLERDKVETGRFRVSVQKNGGVAPLVIDPGYSPETAQACGYEHLVRVTVAWDNEAIRARLNEGRTLPFATLGERGVSLRIR